VGNGMILAGGKTFKDLIHKEKYYRFKFSGRLLFTYFLSNNVKIIQVMQ